MPCPPSVRCPSPTSGEPMSRRLAARRTHHPPSILFSRRFPVFGAMSTGGPVRRCVFVPVHTSRETTHDTAASTHDQRHDRSRTRQQHHGFLPAFRHPTRPALSPQPRPDLRPRSPGLPPVPSPAPRVVLDHLLQRLLSPYAGAVTTPRLSSNILSVMLAHNRQDPIHSVSPEPSHSAAASYPGRPCCISRTETAFHQ